MDLPSTDGSPAGCPDGPKPDAETVAAGGVVDAAAEERARRRARYLVGLVWHAGSFLIINAFFWTLDAIGGGGIGWARWITFSWAFGVAFHALAWWVDGRQLEARKARQYLDEERRTLHRASGESSAASLSRRNGSGASTTPSGAASRRLSSWTLQVTGWAFLAWLCYAQVPPVFDYELGVRMGTQESATRVTEVGTAYWWGFAFGDLVVYVPLLAIGLIGQLRRRAWARPALGAAFGITLYWPIVSLAAVHAAQGAAGWSLVDTRDYWIVLPLILLWGAWGLWQSLRAEW